VGGKGGAKGCFTSVGRSPVHRKTFSPSILLKTKREKHSFNATRYTLPGLGRSWGWVVVEGGGEKEMQNNHYPWGGRGGGKETAKNERGRPGERFETTNTKREGGTLSNRPDQTTRAKKPKKTGGENKDETGKRARKPKGETCRSLDQQEKNPISANGNPRHMGHSLDGRKETVPRLLN